MTMWLARFAAQNATDLSFANAIKDGNFALSHLPIQGANFINLCVGKLGMMGIFTSHKAALAGAILIAAIVGQVGWQKFFAAGLTLFGRTVNAARSIRIMPKYMFLLTRNLQIFNAIVLLVAIRMMDYFPFFEWASQVATHNKAMQKDVPIFAGIGMIRFPNHKVCTMRQSLPIIPSWISFAAAVVSMQIPNRLTLHKPVVSCFANFRDALSAAASALNIYCVSLVAHVAHYITYGATTETEVMI